LRKKLFIITIIVIFALIVLNMAGVKLFPLAVAPTETTLTYNFYCLESEERQCIKTTPALKSGDFSFLPTPPHLSKECEEKYPSTITDVGIPCFGAGCPTENVVPYKDPITGKEGVQQVFTKVRIRSTKNTPIECWSADVDISGEKYSFKVGEVKNINKCFRVRLDGLSATMRGDSMWGFSEKWTLMFDRRCWFSELTEKRRQIEFKKPYTAKISVVNRLGYEFEGGVETKITEGGFFTGTQFIRLEKISRLIEGCTIVPVEIPTEKLKRVSLQFNPLIVFNKGTSYEQKLMGTPVTWIYDRRPPEAITEKVIEEEYVCPEANIFEVESPEEIKSQEYKPALIPTREKRNYLIYIIIAVEIILLSIVGVVIWKRRR